jgi:aqualysin 1
MKRLLAGCLGILSLAACNDATAPSPVQSTPPHTTANAPNADVWAGHYIVVLKSGATTADAILNRHTFAKQLTLGQKFGTVLHGFSAAVSAEDIENLRKDPDVDHIEPDRIVHQMGTETGMGWALDRLDQHLRPLNGAFAYGATGAGVNIYIVDGGLRYTHTEFGGRAHFAFDAFGGNGSDCNGHGTGVAGIAAGSKYGVAKGATIWSVRVFPCSGSSSLSTILAGVDWVTAHHRSPAVANLSLGASWAPILDSAVSKSIQSGVTYVVAAGNSGANACTMSPAKLKTVITVGASDGSDQRTSWSNYGSCVAMFAPGVSVPAADYYSDVSFANWNGTSMSAPVVSGIAALYLSEHPSYSPAQVRSAVVGNATANVLGNTAGSPNRLAYTAWMGGTSSYTTTSTTINITPKFTTYCTASHVCAFNGNGSYVPNGVSSYYWSFGDGYHGTYGAWTHSYLSSRTVTVTLTIKDKTGASKSLSKSITVP